MKTVLLIALLLFLVPGKGGPPSGIVVRCYTNDVLSSQAAEEQAKLENFGWSNVVIRANFNTRWVKVVALQFITEEGKSELSAEEMGLTGNVITCG